MVLEMNNIKNISFWLFSLLLVSTFISSCSDTSLVDVNCDECISYKPDVGELYIDVTINEEYPEVAVIVFKGRIENMDTLLTDTIYEERGYIDVPLNNYYSVMAEYHSGNDLIRAVDGDDFETYKVENECEGICWIIRGGIYNVKLKYR